MNISSTSLYNSFVKTSSTKNSSFCIFNDENQNPETNLPTTVEQQQTMTNVNKKQLLPVIQTTSNDIIQHRINQEIKRRRVFQVLDNNSNQRAPSYLHSNPNLHFPSSVYKPTVDTNNRNIKEDQEGEKVQEEEKEKLAERENTAWLDMLLYLVERKYGKYTLPIPVEDLVQQSSNKVVIKSQVQNEKEREKKKKNTLQRHAQQIHDTSTSSSSSCGCKTGCLKMYCVCFSTRGFCHPNCLCDDCKNTSNSEARLIAIQTYLENDPRAFANAGKMSSSNTSNGFLLLLPEKSSTVGLRGCRCKKSKCSKKYCECYQNGLQCTSLCRCVDCSNHSTHSHVDNNHNHHQSLRTEATKTSFAINNRTDQPPQSSPPFHAVELTVTKKPRRNETRHSFRVCL